MNRAAIIGIVCSATFVAAQQAPAPNGPRPDSGRKGERDLRVEKDVASTAPPQQPIPAVSIPRSYAVVVGISTYRNLPPQDQLKYPERDAQSVFATLISTEGGNFPAENVHLLVGSKATLANIHHEIEEWLPSVTKDDDRVLIYFAGHGFVSRNRAYLAPYDIDRDRIGDTAYAMDALGRAISSKIKGRWKVLLTDACHSGALDPGAPDPASNNETLNKTLTALTPSLFSLTASRDRESSYEGESWGGGHGIFSYYVVKGLQGEADQSRDGIVTADELADYVYRNVRDATKSMQNPTFDRGSFDSDMLLAYVPSNMSPAAPPAPKFGTMVLEVNTNDVEVFLDGKSVGVIGRSNSLTLPGLAPGVHTIKGVKTGYEPDGPKEEIIYPGQSTTVSIRILIARRRTKAALDLLDEGLKFYARGGESNYRKAVESFGKAFGEDPTFSQAALYLGRAYNALFDEEHAKTYFQKAIEIDPDYVEAEASYAGMLLDIGNTDEAIRQLVRATQRDPKYATAWYILAEAYRIKAAYPQSIEAASTAIQLTPNNAEAHFWLAESLRLSNQYDRAKAEYEQYLRFSDFDSKLAGNLNYYVLGYLVGLGRRTKASQQDIWRDLRSLAYFGLCDCDRQQTRYGLAIQECEKALAYDAHDPYTHYALGQALALQGKQTGTVGMLPAARKHFETMLALNPDLVEADLARKNIASISAFLKDQ